MDSKPASTDPKYFLMKQWFLYIIECRDGSLYTGITKDLEKRLAKHNAGIASKYTRGRGPVVLKYIESFTSESSSRKREQELKSLSRVDKLKLVWSGSKSEKKGFKGKTIVFPLSAH